MKTTKKINSKAQLKIQLQPQLQQINKRAFTLIEIMVVLVVLGFIGTLTGIQAKKLLDAHRFEMQVSNFFAALQEAQVLAATYQTDISLDFFTRNGKTCYRFTTFEPFSPSQFDDREILLSQTSKFTFNHKEASILHFEIYAGGRIEPRGILGFYQKNEDSGKILWCDLQHGHLIKCGPCKPSSYKLQIPQKPK